MGYLLSKPADWHVYASEVANHYGWAPATAAKAIKELQKAGYAAPITITSGGHPRRDYCLSDGKNARQNMQKCASTNSIAPRKKISAQVSQCIKELALYMSMYQLTPSAPLQSIKPQIRQIIMAGIKPRLFALYALDCMHAEQGTVDIQAFADDALRVLTYGC